MRNELIKVRGRRTQTEVATKIGISQKHLSKLELGQRTPSFRIAIKIAKFYKKSIEDLFPDLFENEKRMENMQLSLFEDDPELQITGYETTGVKG